MVTYTESQSFPVMHALEVVYTSVSMYASATEHSCDPVARACRVQVTVVCVPTAMSPSCLQLDSLTNSSKLELKYMQAWTSSAYCPVVPLTHTSAVTEYSS